MSRVTNVILNLGLDDEDKIAAINEYFEGTRGFVPEAPPGWCGGTKVLETNVYVGAFDYLDAPGLIAHLRGIVFEQPYSVQLMVMEQDEVWFRLVDVFPLARQRYLQDENVKD